MGVGLWREIVHLSKSLPSIHPLQIVDLDL